MNESIGKPIDRVDGRLKVTGAATYAAEFPVKNVAYGVTITSTITKGRIKNIDTRAAEKMPGVIGIMTSENCMQVHFPAGSDPGSGKYAEKDLLPLQNDRVFYGGQHIAVVVAETFEQAEYAAAMVKVDYDEQTPVVGFEKNWSTAYKPASGLGAPRLKLNGVTQMPPCSVHPLKQSRLTPHPCLAIMQWSRTPALLNGMGRS